MAVFGFVKFWVCSKEVNISFEPGLGNPRFETSEKLNVFNFQLTCFSAIIDFIIWFCTSLSRETWSLEFISQLFFLCSAAKEGFQTQLFKTWVLTQPDFENPKKIHFKPEKGHFRFTLKGPVIWKEKKCVLIQFVEISLLNLLFCICFSNFVE